MSGQTKPGNTNTSNSNGSLGKRKKSKGSKGSYLSKWLDKTMQHIENTPNLDNYDSYVNSNQNWSSQYAPGYDPYRYNFGCSQEPMSLPTLPTYCNPVMPPFYGPDYRYGTGINKSIQVQRPRLRRRSDNRVEETSSTPVKSNSEVGSHNFIQPKNFSDSQDFASLPPIVTSVNDTNSNSDMNINDKDECNNTRRFSDPCVHGLPDVAQPANADIDTNSEGSSSQSGSRVGNRLLSCLLDQITCLKTTNERLNKELLETKIELENVRHQHMLYQKGPTGTMGSSGTGFGQYAPGFVTDVIREIRDAARLREEALYARVRAMLVERSDSGLASSESKYSEKALEEIKSSLRASELDKRRMMDRLNKIEEELRELRTANGVDNTETKLSNGNLEDIDSECARLKKEVAEIKKLKQNADDRSLKLERLVTQLRSKMNSTPLTNGPESLPSESEHETNGRARRTSVNSSSNSTVIFGPVTDL